MKNLDTLCFGRLAALALGGLALAAPSALHAQTCASPGADIVGWWDGDSVNGTLAYDIAEGNDLAAGVVVPRVGLVGDALYFNGNGNRMLAAAGPLVDTTGAFSIECWIRMDPAALGNTSTICAEVGTTVQSHEGQFALRYLTSGKLQFLRKTGSSNSCQLINSTQTAPIGIFTHVVAVFGASNPSNNSDLQLWINGVKNTTVTSSNFGPASPHAFRVGATQPGDSDFAGDIDELTVYRRALTQAEILASFNASFAGRCKDASTAAQDAEFWWGADQECEGFYFDNTGGLALEPVSGAGTGTGIVGSAFELNGSSHYYRTGTAALDTTGSFTIEAWVRPDSTRFQGIVCEWGSEADGIEGQWGLRLLDNNFGGVMQFLRTNGTKISGGRWLAATPSSTSRIPVGQWAHVAASYDAAGDWMKVYVNGVLESNAAALYNNNVLFSQPHEVTVGAYGGQRFDGKLDDVALYRRALTDTEVASHYRSGRWGRLETAANVFRCMPGSRNDFQIQTTVNGLGVPDAPQKYMQAGDILTVSMVSPNGGVVGDVPILGMSVFPEGPGPGSHPTWAAMFLDPAGTYTLFNGLRPGPIGSIVLPPGGIDLSYLIPPGLEGMTVRLQGATFSAPLNFSDAHDVEVRF